MLFDLFGPLLGPLLIVILVIVVFESCWRKCPPDKLMIVSGFGQTRSVSGKGHVRYPRPAACGHVGSRCCAGSVVYGE